MTGHAAQSGHPLRYLALGDSYTIGEGVEQDGRWTYQLAAALRENGIAIEDPRTIATTGWTTDELAAAIDAEAPDAHDFVTLAIGVNNQYRGRDVDNYREEFDALLRRAIGLTGERDDRVLVLGIPDWGQTRFGRESGRDLAQVSRELDDFNAAARDVCEHLGVGFVDVTDASRAPDPEGAMLAEDGLHPSTAMYARWAALALPAALQALSRP